jgi:type II secretory ATPase GspE/PulE/Tfp pilus assembly ATPase PilB-like protein
MQDGTMTVALRDPGDQNFLQMLQFIFNRDVEAVAAPAQQIAAAIERHYPWDHNPEVVTTTFYGDSTAWEAGAPPEPDTAVVNSLVNLILQEACALRATEVHIRPLADCFRVRYRIDGAWTERDRPSRRVLAPVVARLREMAGLYRRVGECRMRGTAGGRPFDLLLRVRETGDGPHVLLSL